MFTLAGPFIIDHLKTSIGQSKKKKMGFALVLYSIQFFNKYSYNFTFILKGMIEKFDHLG